MDATSVSEMSTGSVEMIAGKGVSEVGGYTWMAESDALDDLNKVSVHLDRIDRTAAGSFKKCRAPSLKSFDVEKQLLPYQKAVEEDYRQLGMEAVVSGLARPYRLFVIQIWRQ